MWETTYRAINVFPLVKFGERTFYYSDGNSTTKRTEPCENEGYKVNMTNASVKSAVGFFEDKECSKTKKEEELPKNPTLWDPTLNMFFMKGYEALTSISVLVWNVLCSHKKVNDGHQINGCFSNVPKEWQSKETGYEENSSDLSSTNPYTTPPKPTKKEKGEEFLPSEVLSRAQRIEQLISRHNSDIICLTENNYQPFFGTELNKVSALSVDELKKETYFAKEKIFNTETYEFVTVYPKNPYTFFQGNTVGFRKTKFQNNNKYFSNSNNSALHVPLIEITTNKVIHVIVVHLKGGIDYQETREKQLGEIFEKLEVKKNDEVIICGDFNSGYGYYDPTVEHDYSEESKKIEKKIINKLRIEQIIKAHIDNVVCQITEQEKSGMRYMYSDHVFSTMTKKKSAIIDDEVEENFHFPSDHPIILAEF